MGCPLGEQREHRQRLSLPGASWPHRGPPQPRQRLPARTAVPQAAHRIHPYTDSHPDAGTASLAVPAALVSHAAMNASACGDSAGRSDVTMGWGKPVTPSSAAGTGTGGPTRRLASEPPGSRQRSASRRCRRRCPQWRSSRPWRALGARPGCVRSQASGPPSRFWPPAGGTFTGGFRGGRPRGTSACRACRCASASWRARSVKRW